MKGRLGRCVVVGFVTAAFAASASAESLADAAKRERERRAKIEAEKAAKGDKAAKTLTESDLQNARGETYSQASGPVSPSKPYAPSSSSPRVNRAGSTGSQPAPSGSSGSSVAALEQRVRDLEKQRAALPPGPFGPSVACQEGVDIRFRRTDSAIQRRDAKSERVCDPNLLREHEAQRVQAELDQARAALEQARR
jgi:hypothetical protein